MSSNVNPTKILVIGGGIAGPVLATFLKLKGYEPVVYERFDEVGDDELSHMLQPNGLRLLNQIPGLTCGLSPVPAEMMDAHTMVEWFGDGTHMLMYRPAGNMLSWLITKRGPDPKESDSWKFAENPALDNMKAQLLETWNFGIPKRLIESTNRVIRYGCSDQPALKKWHKGRVVLLGDSAHPVTPHLGQGSNLAFEDIYVLVLCLLKHNRDRSPLSTSQLDTIFTEYEDQRIARSAAIVDQSRKEGENRTIQGPSACLARNQIVKDRWKDAAVVSERYKTLWELEDLISL